MTFKEFLRFAYGLVMGTSVQYVKPSQRYLWPTAAQEIDPRFSIFLGGSGNCGILRDGAEAWLINANQGPAAEALRARLRTAGIERVGTIINTSAYPEFSAGNQLYPEAKIIVGEREERTFEFAGETLRVIPLGQVHSPADLAVVLETRKILFTGGVFYNRIHPFFHAGIEIDVQAWCRTLQSLLARFSPELIVPGEGDLARADDVRGFISYLKDLADPSVEFQTCRQSYDWMEIPRQTSLEENFDLIRERVKTHTTF